MAILKPSPYTSLVSVRICTAKTDTHAGHQQCLVSALNNMHMCYASQCLGV
jgi:hypothetical protein